jgi:hypothetical protein
MFNRFLRSFAPTGDDDIPDVGVTDDRRHDHSNYLEAWYPHKSRLTAAGLENASFLEDLYPGMRFAQANALNLPFADASYDYVHSKCGDRACRFPSKPENVPAGTLAGGMTRHLCHDAQSLVSDRASHRAASCPLSPSGRLSRGFAQARARFFCR